MAAEVICVQIVDQNGPAFRDALIIVRTKVRLGQLIVNASQVGGSASAIVAQPSTGGYALDLLDSAGTNIGKARGMLENMSLRSNTAQAGGASTVTLDASASATNDYYNGDVVMIVGGTGAGQSRVITDCDGTTKVATVNASWAVNPDSTSRFVIVSGTRPWDVALAELAAIPAAGGNAGLKLQFCSGSPSRWTRRPPSRHCTPPPGSASALGPSRTTVPPSWSPRSGSGPRRLRSALPE
jgi:hypothetical protein